MATSASQDGEHGSSNISLAARPVLTVVRASDLPHLTSTSGKEREFYVTATDGVRTERTSAVRSRGWSVRWDETLSGFQVSPTSRLVVHVAARRKLLKDILLEPLVIPFEQLRPFSHREFHLPASPAPTLVLSISLPEAQAPAHEVTATDSSSGVSAELGQGGDVPPEATPDGLSDEGLVDQTKAAASLGAAGEAMSIVKTAHGPVLKLMEAADGAPDGLQKIVEFYETWELVLKNVKWVVDAVDKIAEVHPWAKMAWSVLSIIPKAFLAQVERDEGVKSLLVAIRDAFDLAESADSVQLGKLETKQTAILKEMLHHVCDCGDFIRAYAGDDRFRDRLRKHLVGGTDEQIKRYGDRLEYLRGQFLDHSTVAIQNAVYQIRDDLHQIQDGLSRVPGRLDGLAIRLEQVAGEVAGVGMDAKLGEIPYPQGTRFRLDKRCLSGTRVAFLDHITSWVNDPTSARALVLFGQAGTGKSSIANEIAHHFDETRRLASSFVFSRTERVGRDTSLFFTGLVRDLVDRYPTFKASLWKVIESNTSIRRGAQDYHTIFRSMLLEPLQEVPLIGPIFVVVDALDESGDASGTTGLHTFLAGNIHNLPSNFRILITSRPEKNIVNAFHEAKSMGNLYMDDRHLSSRTHEDIRTYIKGRLSSTTFQLCGEELAANADGLFQWAAVACDYIQDPPPGLEQSECIDNILHPSSDRAGLNPLDALYDAVLTKTFSHDSVLPRFRSVMGLLLASFEPPSIDSIARLCKSMTPPARLGEESIRAIVGHLGSLMSNVTLPSSSLPIVPLHASFRDFLTDEQRSGKFWVNLSGAHRQLASGTLGLMHHEAGFNICRLQSSDLRNSNISDLPSRVAEHISHALSYACRFCAAHLQRCPLDAILVNEAQSFFKNDLLSWLEVLSLVGAANLASQALSTMKVWQAQAYEDPSLTDPLKTLEAWTHDASKFVRYFGMPIAESAPHVYLSALPFAPEASVISQHYTKLFPGTLSLRRGRLSHWPVQEIAIHLGEWCECLAFSPDGRHVASGLLDKTIRVWDAETGQAIAGPFTGHTDSVAFVAFSADGRRITSGSLDGTVRIWDAEAGQAIAGPFTGPTESVTSVALSPDGRRVASGSNNATIRIWEAETGEAIAGPFMGHTHTVKSLTFSPDGRRIASGSQDKAVYIWDAETGQAVAGPSTGHVGAILSITFSPDGHRIASGSEDETVRIWDAGTGQAVAGPFVGHAGWIRSVAFSPDGRHVASGSYDHTIRIWDAETGQAVTGPFTEHTNAVESVAFSPDGHRIASGSWDKTVRIWDAETGQAAAGPSTRHTGWVNPVTFSPDGRRVASGSFGEAVRIRDAEIELVVTEPSMVDVGEINSIAFSPDGRRIASGSQDGKVWIWDAETGQAVAGPLTGHTTRVSSVAFSPDGRRVASGSWDRTFRIWDAETGQAVAIPGVVPHSIDSLAFSPDGRRIASGSWDKTVRIWDVETGQVAGSFTGHTYPVNSVAFSPNGRWVASGSNDNTVRIWDAQTGQTVTKFTGHTKGVDSVAFSPDGRRVASGSDDKTILIWNAETGRVVVSPFVGHTSTIASVAFSPDGRHVASSSWDNTVRIWDAETGQAAAAPFTGHTHRVMSVAFSPNGQSIVSGSYDKTIRLWVVNVGDHAGAPSRPQVSPASSDPSVQEPSDSGPSSSVRRPRLSGSTAIPDPPALADQWAMDEEGWIHGKDGALIIWVPEPYRIGFRYPSNVWVIAPNETILDTSNFAHGTDWTKCYAGNPQNRTKS